MRPTIKIKQTILGISAGLALLSLPRPSAAKFTFNRDSSHIRHDAIHVAKGETRNEDAVTSGPISIEGTMNGDCVSLGGAVNILGDTLGDVASLGGPVAITGTVKGDVASMGGPIVISGTVKGDVGSMGGDVTLADHASVLGDVALMGGKLNKSDSAVLKGEVSRLDWDMMKRFAPIMARYGRNKEIAENVEKGCLLCRIIKYGLLITVTAGFGLMILLLTTFLPKQVERVADAVRHDFWKSAGIGTLILMLILPGLLLMVISILGIPLIPLALLLVCAAILMSLAAFSLILSEKFFAALKKPAPAVLAGVAVGYALLTSLLIIGKLLKIGNGPADLLGAIFLLANDMILCCAVVVGFGAVWTTRMGSREHGPRQSAPSPTPQTL